ncbi:hypothetical protein RHSIM_Rhsim12G0145100 [Rhododendron simsii]|uniref:Piriformospora indica-insensitive protein 2 n=1 Tax=Rhododendron simsii TaxID=118357 RepID=A0A834G1S9_RHOSS|nr:hypothetical protein RHSIM_Rhsim12G0145100 [Rhododendron simsii]
MEKYFNAGGIRVGFYFILVFAGPYVLFGTGQLEDYSIDTVAPMEEREKEALYGGIQGFVGKWWNGSDLYPDPCGWTPIQGVSCDLVNGSWYVSALNIGPFYDNSLECSSNAEFTHHVFDLNHLKSLSFYNCFTQNTLTLTASNWSKLANNLKTLEFRSNPGLTGEIPATFGTLKSLQSLVLLQNGLQGQLPTEMGNLVNLKRLVIAENRLSGPIPAALGSLSKLLILDLNRNSLSGSVPSTFGNLTSLLKLDLSRNELEGKLPVEIGNLRNLTLLDLSGNKFSGGLPRSLQEMVSLKEMSLSDNPIGAGLGGIQWENLEDLEFLDLSNAGLTGKIPDSITELKSLRFLGLVNNSLSGNISPRFQHMPCISALYLSGNNFTGEIGFPASFYGKMGSRFRASENPNLCSSAGGMMTARNGVPVGVKPCQKEKGSGSAPDIDSIGRISLGDWNENSHFVASLGVSVSGFRAKEMVILLVWIMVL